MVYIQRSRGYSLRPSLLIEDIEKIAAIAKKKGAELHCNGRQLLR